MLSKFLSSIDGIWIYPVISLLIFIGLFIVIVIRLLRTDKKLLNRLARLPFENETNEKPNSGM
ncbi:MAG: cbb3-type cytochrome c oxidase subunit 3 [Ignavibacteriales bacterium]|nr:MAG: cbb3-type cytochrome c oxidase subunit 3 [Ignavibacteriales bacterium]